MDDWSDTRMVAVTVEYANPNPEMTEEAGTITFRDDFPLWRPPANRLNTAQKSLVENVFPCRGVVTDGITFYL